MEFDVYCELFLVYARWILFLLANTVFTCVRNLFWILNGTQWRLLQNMKPERYDECAHVLLIVFKHHLDEFIEPRLVDYVLVHDRFVHPEYVLRDDVSMLTITDSKAIFVQRRRGTRPPFHHNFIAFGQWENAEKIITIPLNQFHRLAEGMKDDGGKIVVLQNQSRCGGTLVTNAFLKTGRCVTYNEPGVVNALSKYVHLEPRWDKQTEARTIRNAIRMLCKPYRSFDETPLAYVIKPSVTSMHITDLIQEYVPEAIQLFLYRDPVRVAVSLRRLGQVLPTLRTMFYAPNIPGIVSPMLRFIGHTDITFRSWNHRLSRDLEFGYQLACDTMRLYLDYRAKGVKITGLRYEDLVKYPEIMIRKLFVTCQLPEELVSSAVKAMEEDSQEQTYFSKSELDKAIPNSPKVTDAFLQIARDMAKQFDVPGPDGWDEDLRLPGSLDPSSNKVRKQT